MIIDADYRGEIIVALHNDGENAQIVQPQERIAQFILLPVFNIGFIETETLSETVRGEGGFGSTGTK